MAYVPTPRCRFLDLHSNSLSGTIPDGISTLISLSREMAKGAMQYPLVSTAAAAAAAVLLVLHSSYIADA